MSKPLTVALACLGVSETCVLNGARVTYARWCGAISIWTHTCAQYKTAPPCQHWSPGPFSPLSPHHMSRHLCTKHLRLPPETNFWWSLSVDADGTPCVWFPESRTQSPVNVSPYSISYWAPPVEWKQFFSFLWLVHSAGRRFSLPGMRSDARRAGLTRQWKIFPSAYILRILTYILIYSYLRLL